MNAMNQSSLRGKRVAIYARVSSDKQSASSPDDQIDRCLKMVVERGGEVPTAWCFKDAAVSGASLQRPEFERLMSMVRSRQLDVVVVEDPDRLSRDMADSAFLFKEMGFYDVEVISVSDGMSSFSPSAKTHFFLKGFMGEAFLDNLRDKTLRGQTARFNAGYATGGVAYGFRTTPKTNGVGETIANVISIDDEQAAVVRRIFSDYLAGKSLALIPAGLNAEKIPPPRSNKRSGSPAWGDSTVRGILHNDVYIGIWRFARRRWTKVPGTNVRRPKARSVNDQPLAQERPHLRIIDEKTWTDVQTRLAAVRRHYVRDDKTKDGSHGKPNMYPLSGILVCDHCGSLMFLYGTGTNRRYRCTGNAKRGICTNKLSVLESVARKRLFESARTTLSTDFGIAYARKLAAQQHGDQARSRGKDLKTKQVELAKIEGRIRLLIEQVSDGEAAEYVRQALNELALNAKVLKTELATLQQANSEPIKLPSPDEIRAWVDDLQAFVERDPLAGREYLRMLLKNKQVRLQAQLEGIYLAKTELLPMVLLTETPPPFPEGASSRPHSRPLCGGRI